MSSTPLPPAVYLLAEVRAVAAEFPDHEYTSSHCVYHPTIAQPHGCIVGLAARRIAERYPGLFRDLDNPYVYEDSIDCYEGQMSLPHDEAHTTALSSLYRIQSDQDNGTNWCAAVRY